MPSSVAVRQEKRAQNKAFKDNSAAVEKINAERTTELPEDVVRMLRGLPDGIKQTPYLESSLAKDTGNGAAGHKRYRGHRGSFVLAASAALS